MSVLRSLKCGFQTACVIPVEHITTYLPELHPGPVQVNDSSLLVWETVFLCGGMLLSQMSTTWNCEAKNENDFLEEKNIKLPILLL